MSKFKVGQLVRRIGASCGNVRKGEVYKVYEAFNMYGTLRLKGDSYKYDAGNFEPAYPKDPNVHRELIIEWANGAEIQMFVRGRWVDVEIPSWCSSIEYRVKPEDPNKEEIERIEKEMRKLSDDLAKLRGSNIS